MLNKKKLLLFSENSGMLPPPLPPLVYGIDPNTIFLIDPTTIFELGV